MAVKKTIYTIHYCDVEGREWEDHRSFESKDVAEFVRDGILMFQPEESEVQVTLRSKELFTETTVDAWVAAHGPGAGRKSLNNTTAKSGCDRCDCGCKYWENDRCIDCGTMHNPEKFEEAV